MKTIFFSLIGWIALISSSHGESALIPIEAIGGSIAPYVDKDGYVNPIIPLCNIDFGAGLTLPLVLNFSSAVRPPSPEFGQGWECPLFDAKVFDVQQNLKQMETLGGKDRYFVYNPRTDAWSHYFTDDWTGHVDGDDFELTYKTGCKLAFKEGLIRSLTTPDGRTILWNRVGGKLISLQEGGKTPALLVVYDNLGFAKQILLKPDSAGIAKKVYDLSSSLVYAGIDNIHCPGGRTIAFDRTRDKSSNPVITWTDTLHLPLTLSWDGKTGKIISDDNYKYRITEVEKDNTWPQMSRKNDATGQTETYYYDEKHGTTDKTLSDGTIRHIETILAPGPNYKMVRLIQDTRNGKTQTVLRRAFDDQGHLLLEEMGLGNGQEMVKQYIYNDSGHVVSYTFNGKTIWTNYYDSGTGNLTAREMPQLGIKLAFENLPGGEVKESVQKIGGAVTSTKTLAPKDWDATLTYMQRVE